MARSKKNRLVIQAFSIMGNLLNYEPIIGYGTSNPLGPTLYILAIQKKREKLPYVDVYLMRINPFFPKIAGWWSVNTDDVELMDDISDILHKLCTEKRYDTSCPTLLIPGDMYDLDYTRNMFAQLVLSRDGGYATAERCNRFLADAEERLSYEIKEVDFEEVLGKKYTVDEAKEPFWMVFEYFPQKRLSPSEAAQYVDLQMQLNCINSELRAFDKAYNLSIKFLDTVTPELPYEEFCKLFDAMFNEK